MNIFDGLLHRLGNGPVQSGGGGNQPAGGLFSKVLTGMNADQEERARLGLMGLGLGMNGASSDMLALMQGVDAFRNSFLDRDNRSDGFGGSRSKGLRIGSGTGGVPTSAMQELLAAHSGHLQGLPARFPHGSILKRR